MTTHRHRGSVERSPEYEAWLSMKRRCYSPSCEGWSWIGGKGVRVCERWKKCFQCFFEDVGRRPSPRHQLNRVNKKIDYRPGNVRWAKRREIDRCRSTNKFYKVGNREMCLADWAAESGIGKSTLWYRLKQGMSMREALDRGRRKK